MNVSRHVDPLTGDMCVFDPETLSTVRVPADEALPLLRRQAGRCAWCGLDLGFHLDRQECPPSASMRRTVGGRGTARTLAPRLP